MKPIVFERKATPGLVSIIIPTRHGERFIGDTLATIGAQTYPEWEVIVVEDGSDGPTEQIVAEFARKHRPHRVHYVRNDRSYGAAYSRNVAFAKAGGEFVALLDCDDRWLPDHLEESVRALRETGQDIVYSTVIMVQDGSDMVLGVWGPHFGELNDFPQSLFSRSFVTPSATVLRRTVIADVGPWSLTHLYCEDFDFWLRCIAAGKTFHCIGGCHCLYRKNHVGATTQKLCGTLEEVAITTKQYMSMPGMRPKTCRKYAANAFLLAAQFHLTSNPAVDPSADRLRAGSLMLKGWWLRPKRVNHLFRGMWLLVRERLRRAKYKCEVSPPDPYGKLALSVAPPAERLDLYKAAA
jgi:glycosyltransferase involved in cell wall biosynthesis